MWNQIYATLALTGLTYKVIFVLPLHLWEIHAAVVGLPPLLTILVLDTVTQHGLVHGPFSAPTFVILTRHRTMAWESDLSRVWKLWHIISKHRNLIVRMWTVDRMQITECGDLQIWKSEVWSDGSEKEKAEKQKKQKNRKSSLLSSLKYAITWAKCGVKNSRI